MGYVENNLLSGEQVLYGAKIHWFIFVPGVILLALGLPLLLVCLLVLREGSGPLLLLALPLTFFGVISFLKALIQKLTTELAVTSKRVIAKVGLIRRNTIELNHSKVESFNVDQSIFGRLLGYGTIVVNGTGGGRTPIPNIDAPLQFRREAMQAIDSSQS